MPRVPQYECRSARRNLCFCCLLSLSLSLSLSLVIAVEAFAGATRTGHPSGITLTHTQPNPSNGQVHWDVGRSSRGVVTMQLIGVDGRCLRSWPGFVLPAGRTRVGWDGRDDDGKPVPSGRYYLVVSDAAGGKRSMPMTITR